VPDVRKQQYTKPIPEGAERTTVTVRRRGKDVVVPAIKVKVEQRDGRMKTVSLPVVQSGKGAGTHHLAQGEHYYGTVKGKPVRLLTTKPASMRMLADLISGAEDLQVGVGDRFADHQNVPLAEHVEAFAAAPAPPAVEEASGRPAGVPTPRDATPLPHRRVRLRPARGPRRGEGGGVCASCSPRRPRAAPPSGDSPARTGTRCTS
jgi:hypothetical protein